MHLIYVIFFQWENATGTTESNQAATIESKDKLLGARTLLGAPGLTTRSKDAIRLEAKLRQ